MSFSAKGCLMDIRWMFLVCCVLCKKSTQRKHSAAPCWHYSFFHMSFRWDTKRFAQFDCCALTHAARPLSVANNFAPHVFEEHLCQAFMRCILFSVC